ncbi:MAG: tetratricopeptide repeat protein, partial [archaeon]
MKRLVLFLMVVSITAMVYGQSIDEMIHLNEEATNLCNQSNFYGAAQKWEQGLVIAKRMDHKEGISLFIGNLGVVYNYLGDYPRALSYHEQALKIKREIGDKEGEGRDLGNIGIVYSNLGDYPKALSYYEQALKIKREIGDKEGEGRDLGNIGNVYSNLGDYSKALSYHEQALKIDREIGDKNGEGGDLGNIGSVYWNLGDYPKALSYHEQALKIKREIGDKQGEGTILGNIGLVDSDLGDYPKALSYYEQALKIDREIGDKNGEGGDLGNIGLVYSNLGDYPRALSYYEQALKIRKEIGNKKGEGDNLGNIGLVYSNLGDYPRALSYYEQALKIEREIGDKKGEGNSLNNIGIVYKNLGDYPKALSYYEQALKIKREIGDKKGEGDNLTNLGLVYSDLGDFPKALSYYEQALKIKREIGDKMGEGADLGNIGIVYGNLGDYPRALSYYEQALKIDREIGDKKGEGDNLTNIGNVYWNLGDYPKALSCDEQAMMIRREIGDKKSEGDNLNNIGVVYLNLGDYPKALSYYEQALKIDREIGVPTTTVESNIADIWLNMGKIEEAELTFLRLGDPIRLGRLNLVKQNYPKAIEYFNKSLEYHIENRKAGFLFADFAGLGKGHESLKEYSKSIEYYANAINMAEDQREGLGEAERSHFFAAEVMNFKRIAPYEGMVRVNGFMGKHNEAFFYAENLKARLLSEAIARRHLVETQVLPAKLENEENDYITQIRGLRKQMEVLYKNKAMDIYAEKETELKQVKTKQQEFITRLRKAYPEYAGIHYPQPVKPEEVLLNLNEVLIEFEVTDNATIVFMLKDKKVKTRRIDISREELQQKVLEYRGYFEDISQISDLLKFDPQKGKKLYDLLFGDLLASVKEGTNLVIVPDEFLGILPFEALITDLPKEEKFGEGEFGPFPLGVTYLADRYTLSYAQSATSLSLIRTLKKEVVTGNNMLVVADPIFSATDSRMTQTARLEVAQETINLMGAISDWKQMGMAGIRYRGEERKISEIADELFPRLEKTEVLAGKMKSLFGGKTMVLSGLNAREDKVKNTNFADYGFLTFATHGILDNMVPYIREPALVLSQVGNPEGVDGFLTMSEVMALKL